MMHKKNIYYINRYDLNQTKKVRNYSGYEQVVKYSSKFRRVKNNQFLNTILKKYIFKNLPKDYLSSNLSKEMLLFFKVIFTKEPVFYLYADKDAFLLPLLKRKLKLNWIRIYGTLHWPPDNSKECSFYRNKLLTTFNGIVGLSSTINSLNYKNTKIIPHGIDLSFWQRSNSVKEDNTYLVIGVSNRDHLKQKRIIKTINQIDPKAKFVLIARMEAVQKIYEDIANIEIKKVLVTDAELKCYYEKAKAVILFQNHCLASNVVLESIAMCVPVIANLVGDINEYLGDAYPLYIDDDNENEKLRKFCLTNTFRNDITDHFEEIRSHFDWPNITKETIEFIEQN